MPKTRKTLQPKNLAKYDVLIEDKSIVSPYFEVSNLPPSFTGGRNSFLIAGSSLLKKGSNIQIEILDTNGLPIFQNPVKKYSEGNSRLISVEINDATPTGFATIIIMGQAVSYANGNPIPLNWQDKYNVRWTTKVLVEPLRKNFSKLVLEDVPSIFVEEQRLYNVATSSYNTSTVPITASLHPTLFSGYQVGYVIKADSSSKFIADYNNSYITGTLLIDSISASLYLPIDDILNETTAFSSGQIIKTSTGRNVDKLYLYSGSYQTELLGSTSDITSSARLVYSKLNIENLQIPISYAKLRLVNLNTVSGEIFKFKVYSKVATNISEYKLIADVPVTTSELLITGSLRGDLPVGDFNILPSASSNWYSYTLNTASNSVYSVSGSPEYYDSSLLITSFSLNVTDDILLRSIKAEVPIINNKFSGSLSQSGYFVGNNNSVTLFPTTEYTLQFDAVYKNTSASYNLTGIDPKVDIYLIGVNNTKIIDNNPLGQKVGTIKPITGAETQWYQNQQFNFTPAVVQSGSVAIRFVVSNGFWYFSEISLKPASDPLFSPDEAEIIVPNTEYYNDYLQYKVEFFDINNNSIDLSVTSTPMFFTGSNIDLGVIL
jgi:hypothetical protein